MAERLTTIISGGTCRITAISSCDPCYLSLDHVRSHTSSPRRANTYQLHPLLSIHRSPTPSISNTAVLPHSLTNSSANGPPALTVHGHSVLDQIDKCHHPTAPKPTSQRHTLAPFGLTTLAQNGQTEKKFCRSRERYC